MGSLHRIVYSGDPFGANVQTEPSQYTAPADIPLDVFEALVVGWTEVLVADYERRHPVSISHSIGEDEHENMGHVMDATLNPQ